MMYLLTKFSPRRMATTAAALVLALVSAAHVHAANTITRVAPADLGSHNAIAIGADGFPVIAHMRLDANSYGSALYVTKCGNTECTANNTTSLVDDAAAASPDTWGSSVSIVVPADGLPAISYLADNGFKVAKCGDAACLTGNTLTTLSTVSDDPHVHLVSTTITLSPLTGLPIIGYSLFILTNNFNAIAVCQNPSCSLATQSSIPGSDHYLSFGAMTAGRDGFPVFSYFRYAGGAPDNRYKLMVFKCGNEQCSTGNTTTQLDPENPPPLLLPRSIAPIPPSIAIGADGFPVISYVIYVPLRAESALDDQTPTALAVAKCANAGCTTRTSISVIDNNRTRVGESNTISVDTSGRPAVSYYDRTNKTLKVARCGNKDCSSHNVVNVLDTNVFPHSDFPNGGFWSSMAIPTDGRPIISYSDRESLSPGNLLTGVALKVLRCGNTSCTP